MDVGLTELATAILNGGQVGALLWIARRTREVRQELVDVLEWVRTSESGPRQGDEERRRQ